VTASILYAEDKFDITKEIIKALNDKYKAPAKTEEKHKKIILKKLPSSILRLKAFFEAISSVIRSVPLSAVNVVH
jgi:hypothetical protein